MDAKAKEHRIGNLKQAAAAYALARNPAARRNAAIVALRAIWEIAAAGGAPVEGLPVVNKLIQALEELNAGGSPALLQPAAGNGGGQGADGQQVSPGVSADMALAAALVDALNAFEKMPIQEAIDYVAAKRGLRAATLKTIRQKLKSKTSTDPASAHYKTALATISAQPDPVRAIRTQLTK